MVKRKSTKVLDKPQLNLAYVAVTRAKFSKDKPGTLVFCGPIPNIFKTKEGQNA